MQAESYRSWQRDVIDGVTRRFAIAAVPGLVWAVIARAFRAEWDFVAIVSVLTASAALPLSPRLEPRTRILIIVGVFVGANLVAVVHGRTVPFHGVLMPMGAAFAALMGGMRWGVWTLVLLSAAWLAPWLLVSAGLPSPVDIAWPSQYLRLWFIFTCLTAGVVATILHVTRHLERSLERGDRLLDRVRVEARATQALAGRVREAEEQERGRLAHELHDDLGQRLTALRMKLQLAQMTPQPPPATLEECVRISEDLLRDVRAFARGLRPPLIDEVGLGPALRALFELHASMPGLALDLRIPEDAPRLPHSSEMAIYRVFQEALTNALRHSGASRISFTLRHDDDQMVVTLEDDGRGFDLLEAGRASANGEHLGLVSMRERASFIGAELDVTSASGAGTVVRLRVPRPSATPTLNSQPRAVAS